MSNIQANYLSIDMMRRFIVFALATAALASAALAQPKFTSKVKKSLASINAYDANGNLIHQGTAFAINKDGTFISSYKTFKDAYKAVMADNSGKQHNVSYILGADDAYSLVKFTTDSKSAIPLNMANGVEPVGAALHVIGKDATESASVRDTSMIQGKYVYYGLSKKVSETLIGSPVLNDKGMLIGILHANIGERSYVLDARFSETLKIEAIPSASASVALNNIHMPSALPDNQEEALVYLYFKSRSASNKEYLDIVNRFVETFPQCAEGYLRRATLLIDMKEFDSADADMQRYLSLVSDKADGHFKVASLIYDKLRLMPVPAYDKWTYETAIKHLDDAIGISSAKEDDSQRKSVREYNLLKAQMLTSAGDYDKAIEMFESLNKGVGKNPSIYYAISMARENRGDSIADVIEPIDSAIAMFATPLPADAAKYVMRHGQLKAKAGRYREAVQDYNQYSYLLNHKVNDFFYYERAVVEEEGRMFQQALDDINKAISMAPRVADYYLEKAIILVSVNMADECIEACNKVIELNPDVAEAYRILGYSQFKKGDKEAGKANLQKAIDMKDEVAKTILDTLCK